MLIKVAGSTDLVGNHLGQQLINYSQIISLSMCHCGFHINENLFYLTLLHFTFVTALALIIATSHVHAVLKTL